MQPLLLLTPPPSTISLFPAPLSSSFSSSSCNYYSSHFAITITKPFSSSSSRRRRRRRHPFATPLMVQSRATYEEEEEEEEKDEEAEAQQQQQEFIDIGYINKVHGVRGELSVIPSTDFPHLRFSQPGKRWLRVRVLGKEVISEVELTAGRDHSGKKSWIISLQGIHTPDQAKQFVGSTFLVNKEDRPDLEEDEFYTPDLVGMRVVLKETGRLVGVVANIFNFGANDLLQVMLYSTKEAMDNSNLSNPEIGGASGQLVWVPFVEAIVPEVDMDKREMYITPPKGLLELNVRSDASSKKERRRKKNTEHQKIKKEKENGKEDLEEETPEGEVTEQ